MRAAWRHRVRCLAGLAIAAWLSGCATAPSPQAANGTSRAATFVLVPAAETAGDDAEDPSLSDAGRGRAIALVRALDGMALDAIYVDEFRRTQQTAGPIAHVNPRAKVTPYFSRGPVQELAAQWRIAHPHDRVLVVAQPALLAPLAGALCSCAITPLREDESDRLLRITLPVQRPAQVQTTRYGAPP